MKKLGTLSAAILVLACSVHAESFIWDISGGSVLFSGSGNWSAPPAPSPLVVDAAHSKIAPGHCTDCSLNIDVPFLGFTLGPLLPGFFDKWKFDNGTMSVSGTLSNPTGGAAFSGTLVSFDVGPFSIVRIGPDYNTVDSAPISGAIFMPGLLTAFGISSNLAPTTGGVTFVWTSSATQLGSAFSGRVVSGVLEFDLPPAVPEPGTFLLLLSGLAAAALASRKHLLPKT